MQDIILPADLHLQFIDLPSKEEANQQLSAT